MNFLKNIFGRIWALWGIVSFVFTFLIAFIPSMISYLFKDEKKGQAFFVKTSRVWMDVWLILVGCPVKISGEHYFEKNKNYIVVFNHNALMDVPLSAPYVPGPNKTIAKSSFVKVPLFGMFYKRGAVLVNRKDEDSRIKSYEAMKAVLHKGMHMCIYPEGTRNRTGKPLKEFYDGAFKLASDTGKDIIPCVIFGTKKAMPIDKFFFLLPQKLRMDFLQPVSPARSDVKQLKAKVFDLMRARYTTQQVSKNL